ncbi:hypothetical protein PROFUN_11425 [Planoprotostelium fungivorum]|uniref:Peptidase S53 domain-containing protein n=1 Tax=Planoprotostelium fungivorum TaxID=1890364 RepID=A0A2P6NAA7_9EUKA|nr:hypothetical protein PROFUN_11425 [Planoprotostelium fungivorum]
MVKLKLFGRSHPSADPLRDDDPEIKLTFALKQRNLDKLDALFWDVSNPESPQYGHHLRQSEVVELVSPSQKSVAVVTDWLHNHGVSKMQLTESRDFMTISTSISVAEALLETKFSTFVHISGKRGYKMSSYSVPSHVAPHLDFVSGFRLPNLSFKKTHTERQATHVNPMLRYSALPEDNSPVLIYVNALDSVATVTLLPRCKDGKTTTETSPLCQEEDEGINIVGFDVTAVEERGEKEIDYHFDIKDAKCNPCINNSTACTLSNEKNGLPSGTVYCSLQLSGLTNYLDTYLIITTKYSDSSLSTPGNASSLPFSTSSFVTPRNLAELYKIPAGLKVTNPKSSQSVAEFLDQYYDPADLQKFFRLMGQPDYSHLVRVIGPNNVTLPGGEATLDIEFIMGLALGAPTTFWSVGGLHEGQEQFLEWIVQVLNAADAPYVHSISYGDDETSLTEEYMTRINIEFKKAAVRGLSLLFCSMDSGVYGNGKSDCPAFTPQFPASSPYVTAVGATLLSTQVLPVCEENFAGFEFPCNDVGETTSSTLLGSRITSGGGYSGLFSRPSYQKSAVKGYTPYISDIPSSFYNQTGRVYPDVSALGHNYAVILGQQIAPIDGTSASTPVVAAMITLLNDARFNAGKSALGFLNPWLYSLSSDHFNDVVTGDNKCSEIPWICCEYGYPATPGFDAVTGLGSPNFGSLLRSALKV